MPTPAATKSTLAAEMTEDWPLELASDCRVVPELAAELSLEARLEVLLLGEPVDAVEPLLELTSQFCPAQPASSEVSQSNCLRIARA